MGRARLEASRQQILTFRRRVGALDRRLPEGSESLRAAAWAGLQDSMPRAALLSINARVTATDPRAWQHHTLVQVWGPRYSAYVVAEVDRHVFTMGRLPDSTAARRRAFELADRLEALLDGAEMEYAAAGRALGEPPNRLRYATTSGRVLIRWTGAGRPTIRAVPAPSVDAQVARLELARRYLRVFGPGSHRSFATWAGVTPKQAAATLAALGADLIPVSTPLGETWLLADDEPLLRLSPESSPEARLLPSGDAYYLLQGPDRGLLVPDARHRSTLWTSRVWPGAVLVSGEIVGTWRRAQHRITISPWRRLSTAESGKVEAEAAALPLPDVEAEVAIDWER
ncbi:MAG: crosslink repair DNA glycosylase YcaQ family protein [Acidimicrobiia bacterium]|nr:MAG: crosslink repair DNA glycosylase YcaQ family protein [Acidimicrobiia bacterium]